MPVIDGSLESRSMRARTRRLQAARPQDPEDRERERVIYTLRLDFGKHRGKLLADVPSGYLHWMLRECDNLTPHLRAAVTDELSRRGDAPPAAEREQSRAVVDVRGVLKQCLREMAMRYHPDRNVGRGDEAMRAINHGYERLQKLLRIDR
ncbi:MAG: putative quorum-sensing-regulated virulence factor [Gemmataceae bacterium]